ncbi:aminotransferase class I/II-fold pyridoxal phosphate-dependent enzyme [Amycolatopsis circi]|uniref:aminotransferase class I/II-fold pyridoxal phosphate-dependent enzyme n=1 Tax=Amycolatopsis circi TaxID=871959 RepID=UPI000E227894|nr:ornithine decarboxylase [Amycolatopsis circi]
MLEAIRRFRTSGHVSFLPPGHKQGRGVDPRLAEIVGRDVFASDIILMNGLDDRALNHGALAEAEGLMADAVHADRAFCSTCGSSLSAKSAMLSVAGPSEELLISRNAHKSVVAGLILSGIRPVWVPPRWDRTLHFAHPPGPEETEAAFAEHPSAKGMLLITPTDYGSCADIRGVARVCHERGAPLIVDEAWGAHFPFHPDLPAWAMDAGADLCVTSVHKMGAGLEQGSVYHLRGDLVDADVLAMRADLLDTTSPSSLVYAGLDGWRRHMVEHGKGLLDDVLVLAADTRKRVAGIAGITVLGDAELVGPGRADDRDPLKLLLDVSELGCTGYDANHWLRDRQRVDVGLSDHRRIAAQLTVGDAEDTAARLVEALQALSDHAGELPRAKPVELPTPEDLEPDQAQLPRDAFFGPAEQIPAEKAAGRIAAETISPYPPGVPAVLPGEVLTGPVLDYLRSGVAAGMFLPDPVDPLLRTVRVAAR